jgi:hypothetical protein
LSRMPMRNTTKSPSISAVYLPEYIVAMAAASVVDAPWWGWRGAR